MNQVKVLVADDSAMMRRNLIKILESDPEINVVGYARDGEDAVVKARELKPDVVTMDINMPKMDGLSALQIILSEKICPVLVVSSISQKGTLITLEALELGAFDCIGKPDGSVSAHLLKISDELIKKVKQAGIYGMRTFMKHQREKVNAKGPLPLSRPIIPTAKPGKFKAVCIGISTGGPVTIMDVLPIIPPDINAAIFIVQHMPPNFTAPFAQRLARECPIKVLEGESMAPVKPGHCYVAKGGTHLTLFERPGGEVIIRTPNYPETLFVPSAGVMFESILEVYGKDTIGVLMTGIGDDGADAMVKIRKAGGRTIGESEETAVVYGMPREAFERGGVDVQLPSTKIAKAIINAVEEPTDKWKNVY
ncbi:MAG: chemotaxis response regulator protein-glutamate methylesterase [Candidatus Riflebacteria bacterium]|nr:chemotaxis response regulator protein-glutamate methylesterase [Candidatus Riflebacteria bacterium]